MADDLLRAAHGEAGGEASAAAAGIGAEESRMRQGGASVSDGVQGVGGGAAQIRDSPFSTGIPRGMAVEGRVLQLPPNLLKRPAVEAGPLTELEGGHVKPYVAITQA